MRFTNPLTAIAGQSNNWYGGNTALWTNDPDAKLIIHLMRTEADKLGFIPITSLLNQIRTKDTLIWQTDNANRKIGYLIHSPIRPYKTIHVNLTVIDIDRRRRKFATRALAKLITKAYEANAPLIRLRCAADLEANKFWQSCGFQLAAQIPNMRPDPRLINVWTLPRDRFKTIKHQLLLPAPPPLSHPTPLICDPTD